MIQKNEQSRHIGGKPGARNEAANMKKTKTEQPSPGQKKNSAKPKNADVRNLKKDR